MLRHELALVPKPKKERENERREKSRFAIQREARYKLLNCGDAAEAGRTETVDIGSGGIGFTVEHELPVGSFIELSVSWPVLLDHTCPMRLNVFGRVVRNEPGKCACTIDKYEFRTQSRGLQAAAVRQDAMLERWAEIVRKDAIPPMKTGATTA